MIVLGNVQPQICQVAVPLTQAASSLGNLLRSATQNGWVTRSISQHPAATQTPTISQHQDNTGELEEEVTKNVSTLLSDLGFSHLPHDLLAVHLSPLLTYSSVTPEPSSRINPHWYTSYVSADTFTENKHATQRNHPGTKDGISLFNSGLITQTKLWTQLPMYQQKRGFKTRSAQGLGGGAKKEENPLSRYSFGSIFERKISPENQKTDKFKKILADYNNAPDVQDRLKVAFAEGYVAQDNHSTEQSGWFTKTALRYIIYVGLAVLLVRLFYNAYGGSVKINPLKLESFEVNSEEIHVTFEDVKGVDEAKQELKDVVEFLSDPEKFKALGAKLPKGVLLVGPPGIGKTLLARAVAGEAGVPFFQASGSEFDEMFVGTGAKRVRQLFEAAKESSPCVIFIDEIDTVGAKRTSSQIHPYANQTINQLLAEMDGFIQNEGVIVLGATNRRDNLDAALLRPGRFDVEVRVFAPDLKGRQEILQHYLSKVKVESGIDVDKLARGTTGCTGADLENIINQAALKAAMDTAGAINMTHLEFARDKVLMGPAKKTRIPDEETNLMTAYHEAGHTLVAYFTKEATPINKVTIVPRGLSLGHTSFVPEKEQYNSSRSQLLAQMDVAMGGRVAEEIIYGIDKVTTGAGSDFSQATAIATSMVKQFGMSDKVGMRTFGGDSGQSLLKVNEISPGMMEIIDAEIKRLLSESYERARSILKTHSSEHKALAAALMKYETLDAEEVRAIVEGKSRKL